MDLRLSFNEDAVNYDKWRPKYCSELFADIINFSGINDEKVALEIGCGTGQATEPILKTGCRVTAVELGENMADYAEEKFRKYFNFSIINDDFEKLPLNKNYYDLVYSATAFHWINEEIGYKKVFDILKPNGTIALFWNRAFVNRQDNKMHMKIQSVYKKYFPSDDGEKYIENNIKRYEKIADTVRKHGFKDVEYRIYKGIRKFSAQEYINLLNTYSTHRPIEKDLKAVFEEEIRDAIISEGGMLNTYDTIELYLGRRDSR